MKIRKENDERRRIRGRRNKKEGRKNKTRVKITRVQKQTEHELRNSRKTRTNVCMRSNKENEGK